MVKRAPERACLGIDSIRTSLNGLEKREILMRQDFEPTILCTTPDCSRTKDQLNKGEKFLSVYDVPCTFVNFWKYKGRALKEHILKYIAPQGFNAKITKVQEKY